MDTFHSWALIGILLFVGMVGVLMIEAVFFAYRDKHRSPAPRNVDLNASNDAG